MPRVRDGVRPLNGYGAELSSAWADHLAPRKPDAPTVASLFAGCGGSSLGYSMAGYREVSAVEWDKHAASVFRRNFPEVPLIVGDIAQVRPDVLGLAAGNLDVLDGSPPCQGFSTTGRRQLDDPRNSLFREFVRLLDAWAPRAFVMENVAGMVKGKMRLVFAEALAALKAAGPGYRVKVRLINAAYFRVPQARERLIFIGIRNDLDVEPTHPVAISRPLTVRDAWRDLDRPGPYRPITRGKAPALVPLIPPGRNGSWVLTKGHGLASAFWDTWRLEWDKPSKTLTKSGQSNILHPSEDRVLGTHEMARIQSIPDEYDWGDSTPAEVQARIGNSVPPLLMRAVATTLRDTLDRIDEGRRRDG